MNESALIITDFSPISGCSFQVIDSHAFDFKKLYFENCKKDEEHRFYIQTASPEVFFKKLIKQVTYIKAAGGLVQNEQNEYLIIKRLGKWDLPKGKLEKGEIMKEAAVREVEEECGIKVDALVGKIKSTYHSYVMNGELVIKKTNWYEMKVHNSPELIPQAEEDITEAKWLGRDSFQMVKENTYPLIKELIKSIS